jgi:hypothetical protein
MFLVNTSDFKTPEEREGPQRRSLLTTRGVLSFASRRRKSGVSSGASLTLAKRIQHAAASPYVVDFQLATPINKSGKLKLETSLDPKNFTLAYPRRLEPCTTASQPQLIGKLH